VTIGAAARQHVDETVRVWLGLPTGASVPQLPDNLARQLLRVEEYEQPHRDQWGCWEYGFGEAFREGRLWEPDVDRWAAERRVELAATTPLEPLWPDGRRFAVCLTHDVDFVSRSATPSQAVRSMRTALAGTAGSPREHLVRLARPGVRLARAVNGGISSAPVTDTLELSVEIEKERGVGASYFFTIYPGGASSRYDCVYELTDPCRFRGTRQRIGDVLGTLAAEGFDVGLHGSYNSALEDGMLAREKEALERGTGLQVTTTRQHFLHWDVRTTPRLQEAAGLSADSTLGFNRNLGFRAGTCLPFHHFDLERDERLNLLEVPLVVNDGPLLRNDGLELDVELARGAVRGLIDKVAEVGGVATILFHPNSLERTEFLELFRDSIDYGLGRGGWFASLRELDTWWREREARLAAP
jgi:hypothetical protein